MSLPYCGTQGYGCFESLGHLHFPASIRSHRGLCLFSVKPQVHLLAALSQQTSTTALETQSKKDFELHHKGIRHHPQLINNHTSSNDSQSGPSRMGLRSLNVLYQRITHVRRVCRTRTPPKCSILVSGMAAQFAYEDRSSLKANIQGNPSKPDHWLFATNAVVR